MPDNKRISELGVITAIQPTDISVLVDASVDYKFTFAQLLTFLSANLTIGANISFGTAIPLNTTGKNGDVFVKTTTQQFVQKQSGTWTVVYTVSSTGTLDGTTLYGTSTPPASGTGNNGDTYINTTTGIFYKKSAGSWAQAFSMASGPAGPRGNSVLNGTIDPTAQGVNGDFYINKTALTIFGPKASGVWPSGTSLKGTNGNTILNGTVNPINTQGVNGDFYINDVTKYIFGPKAAGVWPTGVSMIASAQPVYVFREIPTGLVNSSNTVFTLGHTPTAGTEQIFLNGLMQTIATDYTISGGVITFLSAPITGDLIRVNYLYGALAPDFIIRETPTGAVNSSNRIFTLANAPLSSTEQVFLNGFLQVFTSDYTISGTVITMTLAPIIGDILRVNYLK